MTCMIWGPDVHSQDGESARLYWNILLLKHLNPVWKQLSFTQSFWSSSDPGGALVFGETVNRYILEMSF